MKPIVLIVFLITVYRACCSKILFVFPMPSRSHHFLGYALAGALANAGHDVTMVSPYQVKNHPKRYRNIQLTGLEKLWSDKVKINIFDLEDANPFITLFMKGQFGNALTTLTLENPSMQELLKSDEHFDVVILEEFYYSALKAIAHHYAAPLILFSSIGHVSFLNNLIGNPAPPSYIPETDLGCTSEMTFKQRVTSWFYSVISSAYSHLFVCPGQNRIMRRYFRNAPDLNILNYNVSLVFVNSHESIRQAVPHVPNLIDIGGFHLKPPKELPKDLKDFMDNATEGVVYFSMGSNIEPSQMSEDKKKILLNVLGKIKQKVLWKWDEDVIKGKPENVKLSKWFPQQDILAHPNTKLFITHSGLLSTTEAVYYGVPVLGFPIFGDQKMNALRAQEDGYGLYLHFSGITEEKLTQVLNELLNDPKYRDNAKWRSKLMHDRPVKPMDLAIYWTEFVIRHKGAPHLRVAGVDLPWYKYLLLDVISFVILVSVGILVVIYFVVRKICCARKKSKSKLKKN